MSSASSSSTTSFERRTLAVRGERLVLTWSRWSDDAGNETTHLALCSSSAKTGESTYEGRFDEDDFEGAVPGARAPVLRRARARRIAESGATLADIVTAAQPR